MLLVRFFLNRAIGLLLTLVSGTSVAVSAQAVKGAGSKKSKTEAVMSKAVPSKARPSRKVISNRSGKASNTAATKSPSPSKQFETPSKQSSDERRLSFLFRLQKAGALLGQGHIELASSHLPELCRKAASQDEMDLVNRLACELFEKGKLMKKFRVENGDYVGIDPRADNCLSDILDTFFAPHPFNGGQMSRIVEELGDEFAADGAFDLAAQSYTSAVSASMPKPPVKLIIKQATAYSKEGGVMYARDVIRRALRHYPDDSALLETKASLEKMSIGPNEVPLSEERVLNNDAADALAWKEYDFAIEKFRQALAIRPNYKLGKENLSIAYNDRAVKFADESNLASALADLRNSLIILPNETTKSNYNAVLKGLHKNPSSPADHLELARTLVNAGDLEGAAFELNLAKSLGGNGNAELHLLLGQTLELKQDFSAAQSEYRQAERLATAGSANAAEAARRMKELSGKISTNNNR